MGMIINPYRFASGDADATAFLTAAGITDATITSAINTLVTALKTANIWTKFYALYPFVGGTATTHKYNLKDPRDLDAAFRLDFYGTITHNTNGVQGNGSSGYANTYFNPKSQLVSYPDFGISSYVRTNNTCNGIVIGMFDSTNARLSLGIRVNSTYDEFSSNGYLYGNLLTDSLGLFTVVRSSALKVTGYQNDAIKVQNTNKAVTGELNRYIYILCSNDDGTTRYFTNKNIAFSAIHYSFSDSEMTSYYNAIQAFQTTLSRNV